MFNQQTKSNYYYKKPFYKSKKFYFLLVLLFSFFYFVNWSINRAEEKQNLLSSTTQNQNLQAMIISQSGELEIKTMAGQWQKLSDNYELTQGSSLRTGENSRATVELPDKSQIRLNQNAEITFNSITETDINIAQNSGEIYHRINTTSSAIYQVKNDNVEITALGTAFDILVSGQLTDIYAIEGNVKLKISDDNLIINLKTLEENNFARVNPQLKFEEMIKIQKIMANELLNKEWFLQNLEMDKKLNVDLGIFGDILKLTLTEPKATNWQTDLDVLKIKGETTPTAKIYAMGTELKNDGGQFSGELLLKIGDNKIEIVAEDNDKINKIVLNVKCTKTETAKEEKPSNEINEEAPPTQKSLTISGHYFNQKINLNWQADNFKSTSGYLTILSEAPNVDFPGGDHHLLLSPNENSDVFQNLRSGQTYYFIVCENLQNSCGIKSNEISIKFE